MRRLYAGAFFNLYKKPKGENANGRLQKDVEKI